MTDEQRAQPQATATRIGEPADDELLARLTLHLQPVRRAAVLIARVSPLGDHALPAFPARTLPGLGLAEPRHDAERGLELQLLQLLAASIERERRQIATVEPQHVEQVIADGAAPIPDAERLSIQDGVAHC